MVYAAVILAVLVTVGAVFGYDRHNLARAARARRAHERRRSRRQAMWDWSLRVLGRGPRRISYQPTRADPSLVSGHAANPSGSERR